MLLAATVMVSCKSTNGAFTDTSTHGVDASGNVWMNPPPPQEGLQIAVEPFDVPDSAEVQGNFYFHLPSTVPFDVQRIEIAMNEGTHHMNLYKTTTAWPDSGIPRKIVFRYLEGNVDTFTVHYQAQFNATIVRNGGDMMVEAQVPYLNWTFPKLPSGEQTAVHFAANDTLIIENHYVNIANLSGVGAQTTPNGKGKVIINLWRATSGPVVPASMMFARNVYVKVLPHSTPTFSKDCLFGGTSDFKWPIYILGMTGHFHSRGKTFVVDKMRRVVDANGNVISDSVIAPGIYQSAAWSEPPFITYDTPIKLDKIIDNNGTVHQEYIRYTAGYVNNSDSTFNFGAYVAKNEHCNLFTWFAPGYHNGQTVYDDK